MVTKRIQYAKSNTQNFKDKRILITAGPTWVPIDDVRIISNIATGRTGILLAQEASKQGASVTLFLGPVCGSYANASLRIRRFIFFNELKDKIIEELSRRKYDVIIHTAAVADFKTERFRGKIDSDKFYDLKLRPLPKIIRYIRRLAPEAKLVMFKLESGVSRAALLKRAKMAAAKVKADFVVANSLTPYRAFIIDTKGNTVPAQSKRELVKKLLGIIR